MICFADTEDISQVAKIENQIFSMPWSEQNFMDALCNPSAKLWVAKDESGNVQGYLLMFVSLDEGEVTNVAVAESARNAGIGTQLVKAAQDYAISEGMVKIVLEVRISNESAISVYKKNGFQGLGIRKGFYEKPREDALIMAWEM